MNDGVGRRGFAFERPAEVRPLEGLGGGLGGRIRVEFEDFLVEELPLARATGHGEHTRILIEKHGVPTLDVLLFLSKAVKISERRIGYAGLKDSRAVARQYLTVPKVAPERLRGLTHPKFRVLTAAAHGAPLKIGHHKGNRFTIRIRECDPGRIDHARQVLERLVVRGVPNAYGGQRFGVRQDGHVLGRAIVAEDWSEFVDQLLGRPSPAERNPRIVEARHAYDAGNLAEARRLFPKKHRAEKRAVSILANGGSPRAAFDGISPPQRRIWISAWQSWVFNAVLDERLRDDSFDRLLDGDIGRMTDSGAFFEVRDASRDAALARRGTASATGPLVGYDMRYAGGEPGALERLMAAEAGADPEDFRKSVVRARGGRRPLRIVLREASLEREGDDVVVVRFVLPPGAFATVVLDHLMRPPAPSAAPSTLHS